MAAIGRPPTGNVSINIRVKPADWEWIREWADTKGVAPGELLVSCAIVARHYEDFLEEVLSDE